MAALMEYMCSLQTLLKFNGFQSASTKQHSARVCKTPTDATVYYFIVFSRLS